MPMDKLVLGLDLLAVSERPRCARHRPAGDCRALASRGLSILLALEVESAGRTSCPTSGDPAVDPRDEHCQSAVGSASDSRRTAQARDRYWADQRGQVHGAERGPPSQGWKTFLRNHADGIAAMDLFVVPTVSFRLLYGLLIMGHGRRQILWLGVTAHPTAEWIANQLTESCGWERAPALSDPRPGCLLRPCVHPPPSISWHSRSADISTLTLAEWLCGALIGSIRRECLDHVVVFGERHLRHVLSCYMEYYNAARTHLSLGQGHPDPSRRASSRTHPSTIRSRRSASPVRTDLICDRDSRSQRSNPLRTTPLLCSGMIFGRHNNAARTHLSLRKDAPIGRVVQSVGCIKCRPVLVACIANTHGFDYDRDSRRLRTAAKARRAMSIMAAI